MKIDRLVPDMILIIGASGITFFITGKMFNIPMLTIIGINIFYLIGIIGLILSIILFFFMIKSKLSHKKPK
jgi:tellurite resistance protein TehA-like permease